MVEGSAFAELRRVDVGLDALPRPTYSGETPLRLAGMTAIGYNNMSINSGTTVLGVTGKTLEITAEFTLGTAQHREATG